MVSQQFSKPTLMDHFQCSKRKVDEACSLHLISEGIQLLKNKSIHRAQRDIAKCEHFLDFIFHIGLLQDVAYGITNLEYSTVETQAIPHAVVTASYSIYCTTYNTAKKISLFLCLKAYYIKF